MKMFRVHFVLWVVLLVAGFLFGFVPEYQKNRELQTQLEASPRTIASLQARVQLSELRDLSSLMLMELTRQNYGLARGYFDQYYRKLQTEIESAQDPPFKKSLEDLATARDSMASALNEANPSALTSAQAVVSKTFEVTRKP